MSSKSQYRLTPDGAFIIEDYNHSKPFANFFPGVAGVWGIPMWVFYVNRGQGITSFGIESKDKAIMEFQPANKAYRLTSSHGFRTFLKVKSPSKTTFYEPFQNSVGSPFKVTQRMIITAHDMSLEEVNKTLGLTVRVNYFTLPEEPYSALVRRVTVENTSRNKLDIEMIDGMPAIVPYGIKDWLNKNLARTVEAWVKVRNIDKKAPYYHLNVEVADKPEVTHIEEGNFYFSFDPSKSKDALLTPIVESAVVFGQATDFGVPENFVLSSSFKIPARQETSNRTPSAMSYAKFSLTSGKAKEIISLTGFARDIQQLNVIAGAVTAKGFIAQKAERNKAVIEGIKDLCFTHSASTAFNQYCGQTFLDNVLRGGLPVTIQTGEGPVVFNVFSRKHGDLERDYNFFFLSPTYLSQGNGNYRDVNQNRRNDIWFNTDVAENSVINFYSLSQADGYNPLVVRGLTFSIEDDKVIAKLIKENIKSGSVEKLTEFLKKGFMPGDLFQFVVKNKIKLNGTAKEFLNRVLGVCQKHEIADHGEGFWSDHWTYNLDLVESFLSVYPEKLRELFVEKKVFSFFHNDAYVLPRDERYILAPNGVRQYHSVKEAHKEIPAAAGGYKLRVANGKGDVYHTTLLVKMLCLTANKVATLDPSGIGIEMEADKPNWYDALNGLPGLLGSSISETFELKRLAQFCLKAIQESGLCDADTVKVYKELADFKTGLTNMLTFESDPLTAWNKANDVKEHYRALVRLGIEGEEVDVSIHQIKKFLEAVIEKTDAGIKRATDKDGLFPTYFFHQVSDYDVIDGQGKTETPHVRPKAFKRHNLPLFLEGFVHAMRVEEDKDSASALYKQIRKSALFDKKLGMYKVNANLSKMPEDIGRTRIFPSGWLENESIWLHMEYKYLLELLRNGLYKEFYGDIRTALVPFMDPDVYGRSVLENSSFIASSAHEDVALHGQGFVARLSGSTAEFLHMWLFMNAGRQPFRLDGQGGLQLSLEPALPGEFFTKTAATVTVLDQVDGQKSQTVKLPANTYAFKFMGRTLVVYHNPKRLDTFGSKAVTVQSMHAVYAGGEEASVDGSVVPDALARDIRDGKVARLDVELG